MVMSAGRGKFPDKGPVACRFEGPTPMGETVREVLRRSCEEGTTGRTLVRYLLRGPMPPSHFGFFLMGVRRFLTFGHGLFLFDGLYCTDDVVESCEVCDCVDACVDACVGD